MWYPTWMEEMDKQDTPELKAARFKDYWYILEISGAMPTWKPVLWLPHFLYAVLISVNGFYSCVCLIVTAFKVDDLTEIGQYLNYCALILVGLSTVFAFLIFRSKLLWLFQTVEDGFYDYKDDGLLHSGVKDMKMTFRIVKRVLQVTLPIYMCIIGVTVLLSDQIDVTFDTYSFYNTSYVNGVYRNLPVKTWYYNKIETEFDKMVMVLSQALCCTQVALSITAADLTLIFFGQELMLQLKLLRNACRSMDERANIVYRMRNGRTPPQNPLSRSHDPELMKCYEYCLKQIVEHHRIVSKYADEYKVILNWPSGVVILNGSICVAMSVLTLLQGGGKASVMLTSGLLLVGEIISIFILCEIGQRVKDMSEEIFHAMYLFEWMDCCKSVQKDFVFVKHMMKQPIVMIAGSLTPLYRDTFNSVRPSSLVSPPIQLLDDQYVNRGSGEGGSCS